MEISVAVAFAAAFVFIAALLFFVIRLKGAEKEARAELKKADEKYRMLFESSREGSMTTDPEGMVLTANSSAAEMLGYDRPEDLINRRIAGFYKYPEQRKPLFDDLMKAGYMEGYLLTLEKKDGSPLYVIGSDIIRKDDNGNVSRIETSFTNITRQKTAEDEMRNAQLEAQHCVEEKTAFINSVRAVLRSNDLEEALRAVFESCRHLTGASAGYAAFLNRDKTGDRIVFSDPVHMEPLNALHAEIYRTGKPMYLNDFLVSEWAKQVPDRARPHCVLLVPVIIKSEMAGILCLANKPAGFSGNDARIAFIFSEIAALASIGYP